MKLSGSNRHRDRRGYGNEQEVAKTPNQKPNIKNLNNDSKRLHA